jgi:hypothetical protein
LSLGAEFLVGLVASSGQRCDVLQCLIRLDLFIHLAEADTLSWLLLFGGRHDDDMDE